MGWVLMSEREVHRVEVLSGVVAGRMSTTEVEATHWHCFAHKGFNICRHRIRLFVPVRACGSCTRNLHCALNQFSISRPRTRENSPVFAVTRTAPRE